MGGQGAADVPDMMELRLPREGEEAEFLRAHHATTPHAPTFLHHYQEGMPFGRYLDLLGAYARGEQLPPHLVPETFLFAFNATRIVGRVSLRHELNEPLLRLGGHIGYVVVPGFRRQGYATAILRAALDIAFNRLGIPRVLLTCDEDNVGSIKVIETNGGVLENVVRDPALVVPRRRYWIEPEGPKVPVMEQTSQE